MPTPPQAENNRSERFAAYIAARRFDPPRPLLMRAAGLVSRKDRALDAGAGALNATKYLLSAGFANVTALDSAPASQQAAAELPADHVTFVRSRFEDFAFPAEAYDLVNAEFSLPFIRAENFAAVFTRLLGSVKPGGLFTGQLFGSNDSWNKPDSGMNFHSCAEVDVLLRGFELLELEEEDHPGKTKLGEDKHWHIFHIIARKPGA
jgi:tellurite methyltransferase